MNARVRIPSEADYFVALGIFILANFVVSTSFMLISDAEEKWFYEKSEIQFQISDSVLEKLRVADWIFSVRMGLNALNALLLIGLPSKTIVTVSVSKLLIIAQLIMILGCYNYIPELDGYRLREMFQSFLFFNVLLVLFCIRSKRRVFGIPKQLRSNIIRPGARVRAGAKDKSLKFERITPVVVGILYLFYGVAHSLSLFYGFDCVQGSMLEKYLLVFKNVLDYVIAAMCLLSYFYSTLLPLCFVTHLAMLWIAAVVDKMVQSDDNCATVLTREAFPSVVLFLMGMYAISFRPKVEAFYPRKSSLNLTHTENLSLSESVVFSGYTSSDRSTSY